MAVFAPVIAGIIIGILAQGMKGRTGAVWGTLTVALGYGLWFALRSLILANDPLRLADPTFRQAIYVGAAIVVAFVMLLVVLTLPPRRPAGEDATEDADAKRVPCPHCAELILPLAKVCRFCGRDVVPAAGPTPLVDADAKYFLG